MFELSGKRELCSVRAAAATSRTRSVNEGGGEGRKGGVSCTSATASLACSGPPSRLRVKDTDPLLNSSISQSGPVTLESKNKSPKIIEPWFIHQQSNENSN